MVMYRIGIEGFLAHLFYESIELFVESNRVPKIFFKNDSVLGAEEGIPLIYTRFFV